MSASILHKSERAANNHLETKWWIALDYTFLVITRFYYVDDSEEWTIAEGNTKELDENQLRELWETRKGEL